MRPLLLALALSWCACSSGVGDACKQNSDCQGYDLGYCARARVCTRPCGIDTPVGPPGHTYSNDCPSGTSCVQEGPRLVCLTTCKTTNDCPDLFICTDEGNADVCELATPLAEPKS